MIELIKDVLKDNLSNYIKYQTIILIVFTIIIAILQTLQTIWVIKIIENFKITLQKSEIKFSRFHNLQVDALKSIYEKLVLFHIANKNLFNSKYESNNHTKIKNRIYNWIKTYSECLNEFNHNKILFPNNLKSLIQKGSIEFEKVKDILVVKNECLDILEEETNGSWNLMYNDPKNELEIMNDMINEIKSNKEIENSENNILELRKTIEDIFEKMNR